MLYNLLYPLRDSLFVFNIFRYITFRAAMAALTTFFLTIILGPQIIRYLKKFKIQENIRKEGFSELYDKQQHKQGTPTMGGLMIVISVLLATLLWADLTNKYILLTLFAFLGLAVVGFIDDYIKIKLKRSKGLNIKAKFLGQLTVGLILAVILFCDKTISTPMPNTSATFKTAN